MLIAARILQNAGQQEPVHLPVRVRVQVAFDPSRLGG